ncbi:hydrogen peroxide-dependent heme synthase [Oceanobacillus senegalensis]|uniref:hydrogen peroxide-dependent heme synthase n=1 Tax=Oceanobacillus senegalensis TaxID=1936063 RepID=UPI000A304458|nr:hydrogen peroxide-dependent heme synthase [Oceanobacillus senegalensis]
MSAEAVVTMDGWCALHDTRIFDWASWKMAAEEQRKEAVEEFKAIIEKWESVEEAEKGSQAMYKVVGNKADLMFIFFRPTMEELEEIQRELNKSKIGDYLIPGYSYVSIVEMTLHNPMDEGRDRELDPRTKARLNPIIPKWEHACFYPMARRRWKDANWFAISKEERTKLLYEHGMTGRKYAGKVKEIITGSIGLDEYEWGVSLFAHDPLQFKKIVYEMRFDDVTAVYGEFGDFMIGNYMPKEDVATYFAL